MLQPNEKAQPHPRPTSWSAIADEHTRCHTSGSGPGSSKSTSGCVKARPVTTSTGCDAVPHIG